MYRPLPYARKARVCFSDPNVSLNPKHRALSTAVALQPLREALMSKIVSGEGVSGNPPISGRHWVLYIRAPPRSPALLDSGIQDEPCRTRIIPLTVPIQISLSKC